MSRDEVRNKLIGWGIEDPSEEQISDYLATINKEKKSAEDKAQAFKAEAERVKDLERQIKERDEASMSDIEKANKATEEAVQEMEILKQTVKKMTMERDLAEIGIKGEDAEGLFNENGELNTTKLGEILTNREKNAVATYQKEALNSTPSPLGSSEPEEKADVKYAKEYVAKSKANNSQSIIDSYIGGN